MPEISRFSGIVIRMFVEAGGPHDRPHFHAYCEEHEGLYALDQIELLAGSLPEDQEALTMAWAEIHRQQLLDNWAVLRSGHTAAEIEPLK